MTPGTKARVFAIVLAAAIFIVSPEDFPGWLDDLAVAAVAAWLVRKELKGSRRDDDPYAVLGLKAGASPEEIKSAYREQMAQYHPDKVAHLGPELQRLAHQKTLAIQRAFEKLSG